MKRIQAMSLAPCAIFFSLIGQSCSENDTKITPPMYSFNLGAHVIFALTEQNEPVQGHHLATRAEKEAFPKLTYNVQNRVVAELGASDGTVLPPVDTSPYAPSRECALDSALRRAQTLLAKIANTKDNHSQIAPHFLSLSSCATKRALECFLRELDARDWNDLPTAAARGLTLKGIVTRLGACTGSEAPWNTKPHFTIAGNALHFYPAPVVAIYVFAGEHKFYSSTVVTSDSHMKIINQLCPENCFDTSLSAGSLVPSVAGNRLESGKIYTAFLQLTPAQTDDSMFPVVFTAP